MSNTEAGAATDVSLETTVARKPHSVDGLRLALYNAVCRAVEQQASWFVGYDEQIGWFTAGDSDDSADPADLLLEVTPTGAAKRYLDPLEWRRADDGEAVMI